MSLWCVGRFTNDELVVSQFRYIKIDEAHERSIYTDLMLGVLKKWGPALVGPVNYGLSYLKFLEFAENEHHSDSSFLRPP